MDELQAAIKETAEKFAQCFQNKGNFDFSIQSLFHLFQYWIIPKFAITELIKSKLIRYIVC